MTRATIEQEEPRSRRRHGVFFYLFLAFAVVGLLKLSQRRGAAGFRAPDEEPSAPDAPEIPARPSAPGPWTAWSALTTDRRSSPPSPERPESEHRYVVKWTDCSGEDPVRRQERDLTLDQALDEVRRINHHTRSANGSASRFQQLRVYLQCLCGRDVADSTQPHTVPGSGEACPHVRPREERSAQDSGQEARSLYVVAA